ncbi:nuclear transport factor 2 family protein [Lactococcus piscium]|uniref:nuclear transport factor 2 family protein n=1 Tax=Pseudolactococcus carnosus TaxID=2749961 RepID=UPI001FBBE1BB|nr:nuclear transport factor 2 family protein [Lactococcus carnosus]MCJ1995472.1 nuclear transport factor 2 family protein [Lactococcus carnosus]
MTKKQAEKHLAIFQSYTNSWVSKNIDAFLSSLDEQVTIIECFGATYYGKNEAKQWFAHWHHNKNNQVFDWCINQHYFDSQSMTAIFDWDFTYKYKGEHRSFSGITVLRVKHNKIVYMREYKANKDTYRPFK